MQINTSWLKVLSQYGFTNYDLLDPCKNVMAGSWILAKSLADGKNVWSGIGYYHSHTVKYNNLYRNSVSKYHEKLSSIVNLEK